MSTLAEAERLAANPPTQEEKKQFAKEAIKVLENPDNVKQFEKEIENIGTSALQIDQAFDRVNRGFKEMVDKHGKDFPEIADYKREWESFKERWVSYLQTSRDVASEMAVVLQRYDRIFLDLIESIKTDQDRREVIQELAIFSGEKHGTAAQMSLNFRGLEADVRNFGKRFENYLEQKKVEFEEAATRLKDEINALQDQIKTLNERIAESLVAMGAGLALSFWTLIVTGATFVYFVVERIKAEKKLNERTAELAEVNRKQRALAELKTQFDGLKPDIALICEKLAIFGNIWESISLQCVEFGKHLDKGMEAVNDEEFRLQVTLARKTCTPLRNGLLKYATELEKRPASNK